MAAEKRQLREMSTAGAGAQAPPRQIRKIQNRSIAIRFEKPNRKLTNLQRASAAGSKRRKKWPAAIHLPATGDDD